LHGEPEAEGDAALADVPGLLERLDAQQLGQLWPKAQIKVELPNPLRRP
jgi:hypothetical protein